MRRGEFDYWSLVCMESLQWGGGEGDVVCDLGCRGGKRESGCSFRGGELFFGAGWMWLFVGVWCGNMGCSRCIKSKVGIHIQSRDDFQYPIICPPSNKKSNHQSRNSKDIQMNQNLIFFKMFVNTKRMYIGTSGISIKRIMMPLPLSHLHL